MFSSGSERSPSPPHDGRERGGSMAPSGLGDEEEVTGRVGTSFALGGAVSPSMSQGIGLGEEGADYRHGHSGDEEEEEDEEANLGPMTPLASSLRQRGAMGSGFNALEPPKSIPDIDARRGKARITGSRVRTGSPLEEERGAQSGLSLPLSEPRPPAGRGRGDGKLPDGGDHGRGTGSSIGSNRPSLERRRRRADEAVEAKSSDRGKRRHVPTSKRRADSREFPWGFTPADQADALLGSVEYEEGEGCYPSGGGSLVVSDFVSSDSVLAIGDSRTGTVVAIHKVHPNELPRSNNTSNHSGIELLSNFDSKSTWAGASAPSASTSRTGGWGSVLETSSALSQFPGSQLSTASRFDDALWWQHLEQPSLNGDSGIAVVRHGSSSGSSSRRGVVRASPQARLVRGPGGTPARRGSSKSNMESNVVTTGSSGKPRGGVPRPSPGSRRAVMSPHGVAMDAAIRIVEERGARLGILQEEGDAEKAARELAYANQIAAPAMNSQEQRRQRAKAWAKSRAGGTSHQIRTGAMPSLDKTARKSHRDPNVAYRASESHVFSSSGSEGESVTTPPARSRRPSHGSIGTNSARTRSSRSGAGHAVPPQRGTASVRNSSGGEIASSRGSQAPPHRYSTGNGESGVRTTGGIGPTGGGSGSGSIKGTSSNGRRSGSQKSSRRQSAPSSVRDKQPRDPDVTTSTSTAANAATASGGNDSKGIGNKSSSTAKSMPNLSGLLVAPLSRPIPTDAIGYLYGDDYDWRHGDDSRSLTPQPSPSPPPQPPKPPRSERSRRRSLEAGGSGNGHGAARENSSRLQSYNRSDRDVASVSSGWGAGTPPPPTSPSASLRSTSSSQLMRSRSTPDRGVVKVVEHHRRNSSGPVGVVNSSSSSKPRSERRSSTQGITATVRREDGSRSSAPPLVSLKKSKRSREGSSSRGGGSGGSSRSKDERDSRRSDAVYDEDPSQGRRHSLKEKVAGEDSARTGGREGTFDVAIEFNGNNDGRYGEVDVDVVRDHGDVEAEPAIVLPDAPLPRAVVPGETVGIASGTVAAIAAQVEAGGNSTPESSPPRALVIGEEVGIATGTVAAMAARTNKKVRDSNANTYVTEREKDLERSEMRAKAALQRDSAGPGGLAVAAEAAVQTAAAVWAQRDAEVKAAHAAAAQVARQHAEAKARETARALARAKAAAAEALSVGEAGPAATGEMKTADVLVADEDTPWAARVEPEASISDVEDGDEDWVAISRAAEAAEKEKMAAAAEAERAGLEARALEQQRHQQQQKEEEEARANAEATRVGEQAVRALEVNAQEEARQGGGERGVEEAPPAGEGQVLGGRSPGNSDSDRDRGESSASAEMLSAPEEEAEVEGGEGEGDEAERVSDEVLLAQHREAVLKEQEQGEGRRELAMHRAVYDNDLDYLDILLDQAAEEASMKAIANGEVDSPTRTVFSSVGGVDDLSPSVPSASTGPGGVDEADHHGNTPLLLALQLNRLECANALLEAGANVDIKSGRRYHLMDEAVLTGDQAIVRQVYMRAQQLTWLRWRDRLPHLLDILEKIPDFYVEMKWSFTGAFLMAPLMQAVAPSDTYRIWKRGSWLRVDSTIVGVGARFKLKRGRLSLVFMGKDSETPGVLLRVDHTKSKVYNALRRLEWQTNREVDKAVRNLMAASNKGGVDSTQFKAKKTVFRESHKPSKTKSDGGPPCQAFMDGWKCSTYQYLGHMQMRTMRKGGNVVQYVPKESYFSAESNKTLLEKAREAVAREEAGGGGTGAGGMAGGMRKGGGGMFQKPFWKSSAELNDEKVHRQINKQVKATVWMAQDYPLKLKHIMPALEILSVRDDMAARLRSVLSLAGIPQEGFPVKVSVPLMMTVKAVVTFENFRSESVDPRNFVVPREYKRSRRMSKEKYMAGVAAAAASASGGGGKGGNFDSDDEEEEEGEEEVEDEGALSEGEILRRRAASRNAFDDDEDDDTEFDEEISDEDTPSPPPPPPAFPTSASSNGKPASGSGSRPVSGSVSKSSDRRESQSPQMRSRGVSPSEKLPTSSNSHGQVTKPEAALPPPPKVSMGRAAGRASETARGRADSTGQASRRPRGRSMGATAGNVNGGSSRGNSSNANGVVRGRARVENDGSKRPRSKSRGRRLVSQLKGMVGGGGGGAGGGGGRSKRRGSGISGGSGGLRGLGGADFSEDEDDDDSYEDEEGVRRGGNGGEGSQAATLRQPREKRGHRRVSSAYASLGAVEAADGSGGGHGLVEGYHHPARKIHPSLSSSSSLPPHGEEDGAPAVVPSNLRAVEPPPPIGAGRVNGAPASMDAFKHPHSVKPPTLRNSE